MNPIPKAKQLRGKLKKQKYKKPEVPECDIQSAADQYLAVNNIYNIRIPDKIFKWINVNTPTWFRLWFNKTFAGLPDNLCLIKIKEKYCLALCMELKTTEGQLHGKQKVNAKRLNWQIARSTDEVIKIVDEYIEDVKRMEVLTAYENPAKSK